jgi:hypothetical protein
VRGRPDHDLVPDLLDGLFAGGLRAALVHGPAGAGRTHLLGRLVAAAPPDVTVFAPPGRPAHDIPLWTVRELITLAAAATGRPRPERVPP